MKSTRLMMALLCLIFLTTSIGCSSIPKQVQLEGWQSIKKDAPAPEDGQFVTHDGARKVAEQKMENKKLRDLVKEDPTLWERLQRDWLIFSVGGVVGAGGVLILF